MSCGFGAQPFAIMVCLAEIASLLLGLGIAITAYAESSITKGYKRDGAPDWMMPESAQTGHTPTVDSKDFWTLKVFGSNTPQLDGETVRWGYQPLLDSTGDKSLGYSKQSALFQNKQFDASTHPEPESQQQAAEGMEAGSKIQLRRRNGRSGESPQGADTIAGESRSVHKAPPRMVSYGRSVITQPSPIPPLQKQMSDSSPHRATTSRALQESESPMPFEDITISNAQGCLPTEDGNYGSQEGDAVSVFFFYQVEASRGTTETQINGIILDDIEITLLDFMIPIFFQQCSATAETTRSSREAGGYIGMSSKPADFVLRGFECTEKAKEPCFIISGSMTAYTVDLSHTRAQTEMRIAIYKVMESGAIAATISRVHGVALLDDSLNLATLPTTNVPSPQSTPIPTLSPPSIPPSKAPITGMPTRAQTTQKPTVGPVTRQPTQLPSESPSTPATTTVEPTTATGPSPTSQPATNIPVITMAPITEPPPETPVDTDNPTTLESDFPTSVPTLSSGTMPTSNWTDAASSVPVPTSQTKQNVTLQPTQPLTQESTFVINTEEHKSSFEKVPIWAWVIMALAICVCCSWADPDEEEDDDGLTLTIRKKGRGSANLHQHDQGRDSMHDSEAFSSVEYVRKLYRQ